VLRTHSFLEGIAVGTAADGSNSDEIAFDGFAGGAIDVPSGAGPTTLAWLGQTKPGGRFTPVYRTENGVEVAVTSKVAAGHSQLIPAACFAYYALKAVGDAAAVVDVSLKS
jgi:hypothetical protein